MEVVKETKEYKIYKRRDGRHCVKDAKKKAINGEKKIEILTSNGLLKAPAKKRAPAAEEAATETPAQ